MKFNWCNLGFWLETSDRKYLRVLVGAVLYQLSPIIYLFWKSPLTTILNFNMSRLQPDCIICLYTPIHGFTGSPSLPLSLEMSYCWFYFYFLMVAFRQAFLTSAGNLVTSAKLLGYGMKWDTSYRTYPKERNRIYHYFTMNLNTLCKTLPILFLRYLLLSTHFLISWFYHIFWIWHILS